MNAPIEHSALIAELSAELALPPQEISIEILQDKYAKGDESTIQDVRMRVAATLAAEEAEEVRARYTDLFFTTMENGFVPGGRINSAAGMDLEATLINCFVQPIGDCVTGFDDQGRPSIYQALADAAETMRRGGGVGYNFSPIRPFGALVKGTMSRASGPLSYMRIFDRSCETVESAGARRGAQMGILNCDHPDIEAFIHAKDKGEFANFNLSIGVSDKFMLAVKNQEKWALVHEARPTRAEGEEELGVNEDGKHIYRYVNAIDLWKDIMFSTYDHAEPGILFLDRMNEENNLYYCEHIQATNPCAEQPLPPYGCCDLGSLNLTRFVRHAFTAEAFFDEPAFIAHVGPAVRMLDNVLDATKWPLEKQEQEAMNKRRIGLGFMGLGDAMVMLGIRYDRPEGVAFAGRVAEVMRDAAYRASIELAKEKGAFPLFDADKYLAGNFISRLPQDIKDDIRKHGIRNSHLLSIAPTGTISIAFADNASGGLEPPFSWVYDRKKREDDGSMKSYEVADHAWRVYRAMGGDVDNLPEQFVSALQIQVSGHVAVMKAIQPFIDTSLSKTVNIPVDYPFEDFQDLYMEAWEAGLKGLATYRPNSTLGSVLSVKEEPKKEEDAAPAATEAQAASDDADKTLKQIVDEMYSQPFESRPAGTLMGISPKGSFHTAQGEQKFILTINFLSITRDTPFGKVTIQRPIEFLLTSNFTMSSSWDAATRNISLAARYGAPVTKIIENLREITWDHGTIRYGLRPKENKMVPLWHSSDVSVLGYVIEDELKKYGYLDADGKMLKKYTLEPIAGQEDSKELVTWQQVQDMPESGTTPAAEPTAKAIKASTGKKCNECGAMAVVKRDGCEVCTECNATGSCG